MGLYRKPEFLPSISSFGFAPGSESERIYRNGNGEGYHTPKDDLEGKDQLGSWQALSSIGFFYGLEKRVPLANKTSFWKAGATKGLTIP